MDETLKDKFKRIIRFLESSGGKNLKHETIKSGINAGQTAGGAAGILPNTALTMLNNAKNFNYVPTAEQQALDDLIQRKVTKDATYVTNPDEVTTALNQNKAMDDSLQDLGAELVLNRNQQDPLKAAHAWRRGTTKPVSDDVDLEQDPYVRKFKVLAKKD